VFNYLIGASPNGQGVNTSDTGYNEITVMVDEATIYGQQPWTGYVKTLQQDIQLDRAENGGTFVYGPAPDYLTNYWGGILNRCVPSG
jgi:hypothetical protein